MKELSKGEFGMGEKWLRIGKCRDRNFWEGIVGVIRVFVEV